MNFLKNMYFFWGEIFLLARGDYDNNRGTRSSFNKAGNMAAFVVVTTRNKDVISPNSSTIQKWHYIIFENLNKWYFNNGKLKKWKLVENNISLVS